LRNLPRRLARSRSSPPSAPPGPAPSVSPVAAACHRLSRCIAASPLRGDIGLPSGRPVSLRETALLPAPRWIAAWFHPHLPLPDCWGLGPTLATGRHSYGFGHTTRGNAAFYAAWHTHIARVGDLALYRLISGCSPSPACPRAYLYARSIKAGSLPSSALSCAPSQVSGRRWRACAPATVRPSNFTCIFPAYSFHEDSRFRGAIEGIN